ncbi:hypothetical protein PP187_gp200 [Klebsiella phage vB_KvM-Eowyn]|uniref:Uncharacterized protein n=1 Tax=Klebsiella phage vB_KvM-Eowyn TaxID=2762819 RepID=A0A7R8MJK3_9CAUD|nr:hypothetical protein PP187_gp200 [Klebsiella phage vB_KvM-Eowyn]CAD5236189.1 hypothetical protein LLCLJKAH_00200 [Klebsiella phage vB_KvM-Eowyn]
MGIKKIIVGGIVGGIAGGEAGKYVHKTAIELGCSERKAAWAGILTSVVVGTITGDVVRNKLLKNWDNQ